ncbi:MAG: type II secretion system F family protein, partial [Candidatus Nanohaloarchaea archaeon]
QTYQAGGDVGGVLEAVGNNLEEIRKLRKERRSQIYGEMVTGYIIYFVFLGVLVVLIRYLLPSLTFQGGIGVIEG